MPFDNYIPGYRAISSDGNWYVICGHKPFKESCVNQQAAVDKASLYNLQRYAEIRRSEYERQGAADHDIGVASFKFALGDTSEVTRIQAIRLKIQQDWPKPAGEE